MKSEHIDTERLGRYLSNKLTVQEQDLIQEHLHQCQQCSKRLKEMRALHQGFFSKEEAPSKRKRISTGLYIKAAASLALLVGLSLFIYNSTHNNASNSLTPHIPQQRELTNPVLSADSVVKKDTTHLIRKKLMYNEKDHHFDLRKKK